METPSGRFGRNSRDMIHLPTEDPDISLRRPESYDSDSEMTFNLMTNHSQEEGRHHHQLIYELVVFPLKEQSHDIST